MVIIEMNPRVSRSSALASKATGFPIAKIAAKLAVGYTLDEIPNDITRETPACFEPTIDYCVVKIPRFTFEKFPGADPTLTISMKSVGEAMAIGRTFKEALQKGLRSLEVGVSGLEDLGCKIPDEKLAENLRMPNAERVFYIKHALKKGMNVDKIFELTGIDRWFLHNIKEIVELESQLSAIRIQDSALSSQGSVDMLRKAKEYGFSDSQLSRLLKTDESLIHKLREENGILPTFKLVDTCGAEFKAFTPYYYSTYEKAS
jgi:carbamoyl-phosphate synthase large subunit